VPLSCLYGVTDSKENEILLLVKRVMERQPVSLDDWQIRYPTHVDDIACVCLALAQRKMEHCGLYGIWHFSGPDGLTAYEMALAIAKVLQCSHDCVTALPSVSREEIMKTTPRDLKLNCIALEVMGLGKRRSFLDGISKMVQNLDDQ